MRLWCLRGVQDTESGNSGSIVCLRCIVRFATVRRVGKILTAWRGFTKLVSSCWTHMQGWPVHWRGWALLARSLRLKNHKIKESSTKVSRLRGKKKASEDTMSPTGLEPVTFRFVELLLQSNALPTELWRLPYKLSFVTETWPRAW